MGTVIRKSWPRVRKVTIHGLPFYRVDARRKGTLGRQETFKSKQEALDRAGALEKDFAELGADGVAISAELRTYAVKASDLLKPYGKSILEAAEFYKAHLDQDSKRKESATIAKVATAWHQDKENGTTKKLRADTLRGILDARDILVEQFGTKRILEVSTADIRKYLSSLDAGLRRKFNVCSLFSQFFNWAIAHGHTTENPTTPIKIEVEDTDVDLLEPSAALALMKKCTESYKDLILYHAISLFAGLRPTECQLLKWEDIHLEQTTITVLGKTSKTKETRNVHIEPTLMSWLSEYKPATLSGPILPHRNFVKRSQALRVDLGYKAAGKNPGGKEWPQDVLRHSYGSYWLAKFKNRATLAENMGNSVQIIKKHYKKVVSKSECAEYWKIVPGYEGEGVMSRGPSLSRAEEKARRMKRIAKALRDDANAEAEEGGTE